jgi:hypothetical protein
MIKKTSLSIVLFLCLINYQTFCQSLIAGIPSADVAPEGKLMFTHESQVNSWKYDKVKWNSFNFMCYGVQKNLEFTVSFSNLSNSPVAHESIGIGFKKIIDVPVHIPESKFIFGQNVLFGLGDKTTVGGWTYAMYSLRTPKLKTRLTFGLSFGSAELFGYDTITKFEGNMLKKEVIERNPLSFVAGLEQPLIKDKFLLIADWFSGRHDLSALIVGTQINFTHMAFISGYKFQNYENVNSGSIICEIMYEF